MRGHRWCRTSYDNRTAEEVNLVGWMLRDRAGKRFALAGRIPASSR
jgi:hypothetical protein